MAAVINVIAHLEVRYGRINSAKNATLKKNLSSLTRVSLGKKHSTESEIRLCFEPAPHREPNAKH